MKRSLTSILPGSLFALVAPVVFYVVNPDNRIYMSLLEIQRSVFFCLGCFVLFFLLALWISRNSDAAGLMAAVLVLGAFYLWQIALIVVAASALLVVLLKVFRNNFHFAQINMSLSMLAVVLAGWYCLQLVFFLKEIPAPDTDSILAPVIESELAPAFSGERPDIYYIILDGYGRADVLESIYGSDNSSFIRSLEDMGFVVPEDSRANYPQTVLSLGSSLNIQYLDGLAEAMGDTPAWWPIKDSLHHSQVRAFLERLGYQSIFIATDFDYTNIPDGDEYLSPMPIMLNNYESGFVRFTSLSMLEGLDQFIAYPSYSTHRRIIQANFEVLQRIAVNPGPKFVFAHILAPHPPFVFDENGNPVDPDYPFTMVDKMRLIMDVPAYKRSYISELRYINDQVIETIRAILARSGTPPIILLQADHGPGLFMDSESAADTCLFERFSIFTAYYLPGQDPNSIPDGISPVNTFRMVFNTYFSTEYAMLPDRAYFSPSSHFYSFQDITDQIGSNCTAQAGP